MAAILMDHATDAQAGGLANWMAKGLIDARVKTMLDDYTIGGSTETSGSTIDVGGVLPSGANVVAIVIYVSTAQTSLTLSIGDDASATRYASASTSLQTAGTYVFSGQNYVTGTTSGDTQILLTTGGATMTAGNLRIAVFYTFD